MESKSAFKALAIALLLVAAMLPVGTQAAAAQMTFDGDVLSCGCQQQVVEGTIDNFATAPISYTMRAEFDGPFTHFITPKLDISPFSSEKFTVIFTAPCGTPIGKYPYRVIAESAGGERIVSEAVVTIRDCRFLAITLSNASRAVCLGSGADYEVLVRNIGDEPQDINLGTNLQGAIATLSETHFRLEAGTQKKVTLHVEVPDSLNIKNAQSVVFEVYGDSMNCGYHQGSAVGTLQINTCNGLKLNLPSPEILQVLEQATINAELINAQSADTYALSLRSCPAFVTLPVKSVTMQPLEVTNVPLIMVPRLEDAGKNFTCNLDALSGKFGKTYANQTLIIVVQQYSAALTALNATSTTVCAGAPTALAFQLQNTGKASNYAISTSGIAGALSTSNINAAANSQNTFTYQIGGLQPGTYSLSVAAAGTYANARTDVSVKVEQCFGASFAAVPSSLNICPGDTRTATLTVSNLGTKADTFALNLAASSPQITATLNNKELAINGISSAAALLTVSAPVGAQPGSYNIQLTSQSANTKETKNAAVGVTVKSAAECHAVDLTAQATELTKRPCRGEVFNVFVKNSGQYNEVIKLELVNAPSWVSLSQAEMQVDAGETKPLYVHFAPPFSTPVGRYEFRVKASSSFATDFLDLVINVIPITSTDLAQAGLQGVMTLDLSQVPAEFEEGTETPVTVKVKNTASSDIHNVLVFFSSELEVLRAEPFILPANTEKSVTIVVKARPVGGTALVSNVATKVGAYGDESFVERNVTIKAVKSLVRIQSIDSGLTDFGNGTSAIEARITLVNNGKSAVSLTPEFKDFPATLSSNVVSIPANSTAQLTLRTRIPSQQDFNATLKLTDSESKKAYGLPVALSSKSGGSPFSGLFSGAASSGIIALVVLVLIGGALYYYGKQQARKPEEKPAEKKQKK